MKRCPQCRRDYYDETLLYCLDDGAHLVDGPAADEPATAIQGRDTSEAPTRFVSDDLSRRTDRQPAFAKSSLIFAAAGIVLVAALGIGGYYYYGGGGGTSIDSIAVMPFTNESGNPEFEYLSDGIPESLISSLSRLPNLTVKPRSSVFRYKAKLPEPKVLAKELNVQAILIGTVAQRGSDLNLNIELVDTVTERVLWSEVYKRPLANLLSMQTEIAREVTSKLKNRLSGAEESQLAKKDTGNSEAYRLYLKGRFHFGKRTRDDLYKASEYFRQAVAIDPDYARAYSGLADVFLILGGYDSSKPRLDLAREGRAYALRAIALDDSLSEAHASMGLVHHTIDHDFVAAEAEYRRAIDLEPTNAAAMGGLGLFLTCLGRMNEAEDYYRRALEIEPTSLNINRNWGSFLMANRRYEESAEQLRKTLDLDPTFTLGHLGLANAYALQGKYGEAVESYVESRRLIGYDAKALAAMRESFARGGWKEFIVNLNREELPGVNRTYYIRAAQYAGVGEKEKAFEALEKAYSERDGFIPMIKIDPRFDPLRDDPRYAALVKKVGL